MSQNAAAILATAKSINQHCQPHGGCSQVTRATISRAYYAGYHHALALAKAHGFDQNDPALSQGKGAHARLITFLKQAKETALRQLGTRLEKLRHHRTRADYELDAILLMSGVQAIESANKLLEIVATPPL